MRDLPGFSSSSREAMTSLNHECQSRHLIYLMVSLPYEEFWLQILPFLTIINYFEKSDHYRM